MACCFVPFYGQCASVHYYVNGSPRPSREVGGYGWSAGTCPAGLCDARSSFPNPHPDCILSRYLGKLYICTVGEQRMFFQLRSHLRKIDGPDVVHKSDEMRVAH